MRVARRPARVSTQVERQAPATPVQGSVVPAASRLARSAPAAPFPFPASAQVEGTTSTGPVQDSVVPAASWPARSAPAAPFPFPASVPGQAGRPSEPAPQANAGGRKGGGVPAAHSSAVRTAASSPSAERRPAALPTREHSRDRRPDPLPTARACSSAASLQTGGQIAVGPELPRSRRMPSGRIPETPPGRGQGKAARGRSGRKTRVCSNP